MPTETNTPTPAPTATPTPPYPVMPAGVSYIANCGLAQMKVIIQQPNGRFMNNYRVRLTAGNFSAVSPPTGDLQRNFEPGKTEITMDSQARDGRWVAIVLDQQGNVVSPPVEFDTNTVNCQPGGSGHQIAVLRFTRYR